MPSLETPSRPDSSTGGPPPPTPPQPVKITSRRFGELEEHELIHLLDSIDDEIAKARFRESIYISIIFCLALAWLAFYGPRVLFHQGRIANPPAEVAKTAPKELKFLDLPKNLIHKPPPKTDNISDQDRVAQTHHPEPTPPKPPAGAPGQPHPAPLPEAPQPQPQRSAPVQQAQQPPPPRPQPQPSNIPDAPRPSIQAANRPNFNTSQTPGQSIRDAASSALRGSGGSYGTSGRARGGAMVNNGAEILSDTLGVDFGPYIKRLLRMLYDAWLPLIPEETRPPLNKEGTTLIRFTINKDGTVAAMHLDDSTHDQAIDRAAWGSITSVGQFEPLPKQFNGPDLELRIHFVITHEPARE